MMKSKLFALLFFGAVVASQAHAEWFLRGSHNGWTADQMQDIGSNTLLAENVTFTSAGELKFDRWGDWSENYGAGGVQGGANIQIAQGVWDIEFYTDTKGYTFTPVVTNTDYHFRGTVNNWLEGTLMKPVVGNTDLVDICVLFSSGSNSRFKIDPNGGWGDAVPAQDYYVSDGVKRVVYNTVTDEILVEGNCTIQEDEVLHTWWHNNHELNNATPVADENVRRSTRYDVFVSASEDSTRYQSFTYMSIPRNGMHPYNVSNPLYHSCQSYNDQVYGSNYCKDGAQFAEEQSLTMSWSTFQYGQEGAHVYIESHVDLLPTNQVSKNEQVRILPDDIQGLTFDIDDVSDTVHVFIPYSATGYRISVEFSDDYFTSYNDLIADSGSISGTLTGNPFNSHGGHNREIHTEPRNGLLIFADPFLTPEQTADFVPPANDPQTVYYPEPGLLALNNHSNTAVNAVYFRPGVYYMGGNKRGYLPPHLNKIYLAPGAYVKGAFEFNGAYANGEAIPAYSIVGPGVLSGEQYVYEAYITKTTGDEQGKINPILDRRNPDNVTEAGCNADCLKMLQFYSMDDGQTLDIIGVTVANIPYHSFVLQGNKSTFTMAIERYKQVGSWYWQTDGVEVYDNGTMKSTFFHANDDIIKLYHSNVTIEDAVVWKSENGPLIQFGWEPRNINADGSTSSVVDGVDLIHNRMYWQDAKSNTCIINSSLPSNLDVKADPAMAVRNLTLKNIHAYGKNLCAMRLAVLSQWENINIENLTIDEWNGMDVSSQENFFYQHSDSQDILVGVELPSGASGLSIFNYNVHDEDGALHCVSKWNSTSDAGAIGRIAFDASLGNHWNAWCP